MNGVNTISIGSRSLEIHLPQQSVKLFLKQREYVCDYQQVRVDDHCGQSGAHQYQQQQQKWDDLAPLDGLILLEYCHQRQATTTRQNRSGPPAPLIVSLSLSLCSATTQGRPRKTPSPSNVAFCSLSFKPQKHITGRTHR